MKWFLSYLGIKVDNNIVAFRPQKVKRKVQGVPQSQAAALSRHQEEEEPDKTKQLQIKQTYEKHLN